MLTLQAGSQTLVLYAKFLLQVGDTTGAIGRGDISGVAAGATGGVSAISCLRTDLVGFISTQHQLTVNLSFTGR